ncbi:MAG: TolC family protein [Deltaproteobacteria bacterium]|nr:TolC family protein [Deltaproteobacteria bacterium]
MLSRCGAWSMTSLGLALAVLGASGCAFQQTPQYETLRRDWERADLPAERRAPDAYPLEHVAVLERAPLVQLVLERNPSIRAARFAWRAALERYPQVTALDDPMFGIGIAPRSIGSRNVDDAPKFDLSQKLPFPGKLRLRGQAATAEAEAASHDFASVRLRLATMTSLLFDDHYLAERALEINAEHVALLEEFKRIATVRYESGAGSQQDPIQAEVELTHALHRNLVLQTAQRVTAEQINSLLHRPATRRLPPPPPRTRAARGTAGPEKPPTQQALEDKPEVAAAAARVAAEEARVDLAWREYFPDFTLVGSYNRVWQEHDLQPFVGLQFNVPLRLGRRKAALEEARAHLERARSEHTAIEDEVRFGVESGHDRLVEAHHVLRLFGDRLLPAARDQIAAARSGFETGRNSFLALIDAERNLRNVELGYEEALADLSRRRAELDQTVGRIPGLTW